MTTRFNIVWLVLVALLLPAGSRASCVTATCHANYGQAATVHAPVADRDCTACHQATGSKHPGAESMRLVTTGRDLCLSCHEEPAAGNPILHQPIVADCTLCHDPHQSPNASLLRQPPGPLCLSCHPKTLEGKQVHGPAAAGNCLLCHLPHAGETHALVKRDGNRVCLGCHVDIAKTIAAAKYPHEPVATGSCGQCHDPHASDYSGLLRASSPRDFYASYSTDLYALCYQCHSASAIEYDITSEATGFRNRTRNLHFLHVNRSDKGRTCRSCHGVHGADQPKLLLSRVPGFGEWGIPLRWEERKNGAACYVGCHAPKAYDRVDGYYKKVVRQAAP